MSNWILALFVVVFIGFRFLSWYRSKDLSSPEKELTRLSFAAILLLVAFVFLIFNQPFLYVPPFDGAIETIQDARSAIVEQNAVLRRLVEEVEDYNRYKLLLLFVLACYLVPALYSFSKALVTGKSDDDEHDGEKMISILGDDKNNDR